MNTLALSIPTIHSVNQGLANRNTVIKQDALRDILKLTKPHQARFELAVAKLIKRTTDRDTWKVAMDVMAELNLETWVELQRSHPWGTCGNNARQTRVRFDASGFVA